MALPEPTPRDMAHLRKITYKGFRRSDGLWDIEGELLDCKPLHGELARTSEESVGQTIHCMSVRVVVNSDYVVREAFAEMREVPFALCNKGMEPIHLLAGAKLDKGWRRAIEGALGDIRGCTHLRELLHGIGTAAYQTIGPANEQLVELRDEAKSPGRHFGQCVSWDFGSSVVKELKPEFYKPRENPKSRP